MRANEQSSESGGPRGDRPALPDRQGQRRGRFALREGLWKVSGERRLRSCGRRKIAADRPVEGVENDGVAHLTNLQLCGSVHSCPVCAPRIRSARAREIEAGLARWLKAGGGCEFVTGTLAHDQGDRLAPLLEAVTESWSAVTSGRAWVGEPVYDGKGKSRRVVRREGAMRDRLGVEGQIRALEVTHGESGFHPHVHVLVFTVEPLDLARRGELLGHVAGVWGRSVVRAGYRPPSHVKGRAVPSALVGGVVGVHRKGSMLSLGGCTVSPVTTARDLARYTAKVEDEGGATRAVGNEMARHDFKAGRRKGRTPFQVLASAVLDGDADDLAVWEEYERSIRGQRAIAWSKGLKALLLVEEVSDQEIVDAPIGGRVLVTLSDDDRRALMFTRGATAALHDALEVGQGEAERYLADLRGRFFGRWGRSRAA